MRPPENCGGPWGYAEKFEALGDSHHEYSEESLETLGDDYDSNAKPDIPLIGARLEAREKMGAMDTPESLTGRVNAAFRRRLPKGGGWIGSQVPIAPRGVL